MRIEYLHASKFGNGVMVAAHFKEKLAAQGIDVDVHNIREVRPAELPPADLYVFSSPGRFGKPIRAMRRFLKKVSLPAGTRYAILTTEAMPKADKTTGQMPTEEEQVANHQRVRPIMNEILEGNGLVKIAEDKVHVTGLKGPLEDGWETKVDAFASALHASLGRGAAAPARTPLDAAYTRVPV
jgi:menaquinone-dependent protoporphyrinogen IX oxidase